MSLFRALLLCLTISLSACGGFEPMLAAKPDAQMQTGAAMPDIEIGNIPDQEGQYLRNVLIDRLYTDGRPAAALYQLSFSPLLKDIMNLGIQKDATATRAQMQITTQMQLIEKSTGKVVLRRDLKTVGAYNLLDNQLATLVSQRNITESILQEMGDNAVTELNLYFRRKSFQPPL